MKHLKVLLVMELTIHSLPTKRSSGAGLYPSFLHARMHECAGEQFLNTAMQLLLCAGAWDAVSGNAGLAISAATTTPATTLLQSPSTEPSGKTRLVGIAPPRLGAPPAQLQTSSFDLDAEIEAYVGKHALQGFTFAELHEAMRSKSPALTRRETYFAILESCASHPRTLFSADAMNRLVYRDGRFVQSSKELLSAALKPLDDMVAEIIDSLSFDEPTQAINVSPDKGVSTGKQQMVLAGLQQAGFVVELDEGLQLAHSAVWTPRLKLLERAHIRWTNRFAQRSFRRAPGPMPEESPLGISQASVISAQVPDVEPAVESMEGGTESQEVLTKRRDHQKDIVFSHLAKLRHSMGEKTDVQLYFLITELMGKSGLDEESVSRLLKGTYPMYRSPFLAMVTGNGYTVTIVADLGGNPHLQNLPLTRAEIENSPILQSKAR